MLKNVDELIAKVSLAYNHYNHTALDNIWAHLFDCCNEILKVDGSNQYKAPHKGAGRFRAAATSAVDLRVDVNEYNRVFGLFP